MSTEFKNPWKKVGYIATSKKDPKKFNLVMEKEDGTKEYFILRGKPTEEEVEANPKLAKMAENFPAWKRFDVLKAPVND
jgi:hypothetical protein